MIGKKARFMPMPAVNKSSSPGGSSGSLSIPKMNPPHGKTGPPSITRSSPDPAQKHPINIKVRPYPEASRKT